MTLDRRCAVASTRRAWKASVLALVAAATTVTSAADTGQKLFEKQWTGRHVIVTRMLYSLVYNERGRTGSVRLGRSGLIVVTPFAGTYFQFDGRRRVDDVVEHDVQKVADAVTVAYRKDRFLGEGWVQEIEPVLLEHYDPGIELLVKTAVVERDVVRLELIRPGIGEDEAMTSLTVKWPLILSKSFSERGNVEALIRQYLGVTP
jgi:hypothetical protein